jgi:hypothetical protein
MLAALAALFEKHRRLGKVAMEYELRVFAGRL